MKPRSVYLSEEGWMVLLGTTYEGGAPQLLDDMAQIVDAIEVTPDAIASLSESGEMHLRSDVLRDLLRLSQKLPLVAHGVGLSIGSYDQWNEGYLGLLDQLMDSVNVFWHSEHLACTTVDGENVGTMLALPRTQEALDLVSTRVERLQRRYNKEFLLEHVIRLLPEPEAEYSDAGFLNALVKRTGCGLIVDAYNLECDQVNYGFDVDAFLDELDMQAVREIHLAGGVQHNGFQLDIHSRQTADSTVALAARIMARASGLRLITYELLTEAIPLLGHEAICAELRRLRRALLSCPN